MRPGARIQSAIELNQAYAPNMGPFDVFMHQFFRHNRYIGSKDRQAITQYCYGIWRTYPSLLTLAEKAFNNISMRSLMLVYLRYVEALTLDQITQLFTGEAYDPHPLSADEKKALEGEQTIKDPSHFPDWLLPLISKENRMALNQGATFDVRVNEKKTTREEMLEYFESQEMQATPCAFSPLGIRLQKRRNLSELFPYKDGLFFVQDEGAQMICELLPIKDRQRICDYCAGAGGKSLGLAARLSDHSLITATDISTSRLEKMAERVKRAGFKNILIEPIHQAEQDQYDWVLADVPCSGTGTLRRRPELKAFLTESDVQGYVKLQASILERAADLVKPGGHLVYITCSLLKSENEDQINAFLKNHPAFTPVQMDPKCSRIDSNNIKEGEFIYLTPQEHGTDGFFLAICKRN